jgi:hypothetical protein
MTARLAASDLYRFFHAGDDETLALQGVSLAVAAGEVVEERLAVGGPPLRRRLRAGEAIDFAASDIHRVAHAGARPAITINAYSPPLWRMGAYETMPTGELQRHSISYAEELRPLGYGIELASGPGI